MSGSGSDPDGPWASPIDVLQIRIRKLESQLKVSEGFRDKHRGHVEGLQIEINRLEGRVADLQAALRSLYDGTAEYVYLNHLGDPHNTTPMRNAAAALGLPELFNYDRLREMTAAQRPGVTNE